MQNNNMPIDMKHSMEPNKHPKALSILFLSEMWERFGFYIIQGLLIFYITKVFGFTDTQSYTLLGVYTAFVYISPVVGGLIADKILGFRLSITVGSILLSLGYGMLAYGESLIYVSLATIIVGNGFFKPNISSLLGKLYKPNDPRRDAGFTIFYVGINLGVVLATTTAGFIQQKYGWSASFWMASAGLLIAFFTFITNFNKLQGEGLSPPPMQFKYKWLRLLINKPMVFVAIIISIGVFTFLLQMPDIADILLWLTGVVVLTVLIVLAYKQADKFATNKMLALIILTASSIVFWAVFFQMFASVNLFIDRDVNRMVFGIELPPILFLSLESFFVIGLGPPLARLWQKLERRKKNVSIPAKFSCACFSIGIGFAFLWMSTYFPYDHGMINPFWIVLTYFFITFGEMLLSPIGLSAVTVLSPPSLVGMMMGVWFIALGFGGKLSGVIANMSSIPEGTHNVLTEISLYGHGFMIYAIMSFIVGIILFCLIPLLKRMMVDA